MGDKPSNEDTPGCSLWGVTATLNPKLGAGRDSVPLSAMLSDGPHELKLNLVGDGKACQAGAAPKKPGDKAEIAGITTPAGGALLACHDRETVTVQGAKLGSIDGARLNGVPAKTIKSSAAGDVLTLDFENLPSYPPKHDPGAKETTLELLVGKDVKATRTLTWAVCPN